MRSSRYTNDSLVINLKKYVIRTVTSKKTIEQELVFASKHPFVAFCIIAILVLAGLLYYNSPYSNFQYTKPKITGRNGSVAGVNSKEKKIISGETQALILPNYIGFRILGEEKYPDTNKTPGTVYENITEKDVCDPGYSKRIRNVPILQKKSIYRSYNVKFPQPSGAYEVDHFIPLSIGGSNDDKNLWPEPAVPIPGFREKDKVEYYLYSEICAGRISIKAAQESIRTDWYKVYQNISFSTLTSDPDGDKLE
jgi:hypothetical protein